MQKKIALDSGWLCQADSHQKYCLPSFDDSHWEARGNSRLTVAVFLRTIEKKGEAKITISSNMGDKSITFTVV